MFVAIIFLGLPGFTLLSLVMVSQGSVIIEDAVVLAGIFLTGTYGLNPLGGEGEVLPVLLTSTTPGRCFVRARILAVLSLGTPLFLIYLAIASFVFVSLVGYVLLIVFSLYFLVLSAVLAVGIGSHFPGFEKFPNPDVDFVMPSDNAFVGYSLTLLTLGVIGFLPVNTFHSGTVASGVLGLGIYVALTGPVGYSFYAYSVRRFDSYRLD